MIAPNIILIWTGSVGSIPAGWSRETTLDDKYPKAWGAEAINTTGGAATHSHTATTHGHTASSHSHDVTTLHNSSPPNYSNRSDNVVDNHNHQLSPIAGVSGGDLQNTVVTWASINHEPPYHTVIFIKAAGYGLVPPSAVGFFNSATIPSNYTFCNGGGGTPDLRNKYIKGAAAGDGAGSTGGALTHGHTVTHGHTANSHSHSASSQPNNGTGWRGAGGSNVGSYNGHRHNITLYGITDSVNNYINTTAGNGDTVEPAYKKQLAIMNTSGNLVLPATGMIALWLGSTSLVPAGWYLCDGNNGTPDLRDKFIKIANTTGEIGSTGGANTHTHTVVSHTHTSTGTHNHTGYTGGPDSTLAADSGGDGAGHGTHTHPLDTVSSVSAAYANTNLDSGSAVDNQPPYRTVGYIQYAFPVGGGAMFGLL